MIRRVRADGLPTYDMHPDTGCDLHPACLTCPLPMCRYDDPGGAMGLLRPARDAAIVNAHRQGMSTKEICQHFRLEKRTVYRILARAKRG